MLFLGRLHWSKALELQAQALSLLVEEFPNLMWVLVGPDTGLWNSLSNRISELGLQKHVLWTNSLPRDACFGALTDTDVFLLTSEFEAHSMAMNEALAVGVPIVITDSVQFEAVQKSGAGMVVQREPTEIAKAIAHILRNPAEADRMRGAGRKLVNEHLAWHKVAGAMSDAYRKVLHG